MGTEQNIGRVVQVVIIPVLVNDKLIRGLPVNLYCDKGFNLEAVRKR